MKNIAIAAVTATLLTASVAHANDLTALGGLEYATKAEAFEATVGAEYAAGDFTLTALLTADDTTNDFEFVGADLIVGYALSPVVAVYATIETDSDWDRVESVVGASFRF